MIIIKNNLIPGEMPLEYVITGHAGYAEHGKDIVCSAVSTLHYSFIKWMNERGIQFSCSDDGNILAVSVGDELARNCFEMVITGFEGISDAYGDYVKIVYT